MEEIGEALFSVVFEIVGEVAGEVINDVVENFLSSELLTFINSKLPIANTFSSEIITLDIQVNNYKKEIL